MSTDLKNGSIRCIDGTERIYFDGYWIRYYAPPDDTLRARHDLIKSLTRRTFHHTEPGINTPGYRLEEARSFFEESEDPGQKRVNAAMLAGALFNRATDIFTSVVDLERKGVNISHDNELMRLCGEYLEEAMELGKQVKHYSGHEGIDELWGEPLKAFSLPIEAFYQSRYIKIAQTWRDVDIIAETLVEVIGTDEAFADLSDLIYQLASAAKQECETMRMDRNIFIVWPFFVSTSEKVANFRPDDLAIVGPGLRADYDRRLDLVCKGKELLNFLAQARVPMPKSTREYLDQCESYIAERNHYIPIHGSGLSEAAS